MPTVSIVAALGLGAGGIVLGATVAPHSTTPISSGTETVSVISPVATGTPPEGDGASGDSLRVSPALAEREVHRPADDASAIDPSLQHIIDELTDAPNPVVERMTLDGDADSSDSDVADDPCAPRDGSDPADCPEGLHSTVLPIIALRDFSASGQAFPPTSEEYRLHGNRLGGALWCDGQHSGPSSVPFGILSTAPGSFSIRYWPSAHPDLATTAGDITTSVADQQAFEDAVATARTSSDIPLLRQCFTLEDLEPATAYTAVVSGVDTSGRISPPSTVRFNSSGSPVHPGAQITPIGENLVFVSALHPADETVTVRASVMPDADAPSCNEIDHGRALSPMTATDASVTSDEINAVNAPPGFTRKQVSTFAVPEGSTVLVCARWYAAGTSPSWLRVSPNFESSAILQSPDRVEPRVTLTRVTPFAPGLARIRFLVTSAEGNVCGGGTWDTTISGYDALPLTVCDLSGSAGSAAVDSRGYLSDRGESGDLVVRMTSGFSNNATVDTDVLIPSIDGGCRGVCSLPDSAWYEVALGTIDRPTGLCGSSFGDCTPPTRAISAGTVQLEVSWTQGSTNGRADWAVTPTVDSAPDYVVPEEVQLDLNQEWTFSDPSYPAGYGNIAPLPYVNGTYRLVVDRPVHYLVRFTDGVPGEASVSCATGTPLEVRGHADREATIVMPGACVGALYYAEIELVDATGHGTVWNLQDRSHYWGSASILSVPTIAASMQYDVRAQGSSRSALTNFALMIGASDVGATDTRSGRCTADGIVESHGVVDAHLSSIVAIRLQIRIRAANHWEPNDCRDFSDDAELRVVEASVPLADLYRPEGVTIDAPEAFAAHIVLHAYRP
ncbi:MAG: hypothetical protein KF801_04430 [Cryobacterium sp.]|nr:hypothetical protein [Cryobacterium sp.]